LRLFIGNLPYDTSEAELTSLFEGYGEILGINLVLDQFTGKSKGFAFVEMSTRSGGQQALEALNKRKYKNKILACNEAQNKKKRKRRR
jgi:RNA recognition motif-containing protein